MTAATGTQTPLTADEFHDEWVNRGMFCTGTHAVGEALCQNVVATIAFLEATRPATDPARLDGRAVEAAIAAATPLINPRLSEVDWDAVAERLIADKAAR